MLFPLLMSLSPLLDFAPCRFHLVSFPSCRCASRSCVSLCACRVSGAIALMGYEMRNRVVSWGRGMIGNGVRLFLVLVLLAGPPFARRDTIVEAATPPPACLLAGVFFSIWGWMGERGEDGGDRREDDEARLPRYHCRHGGTREQDHAYATRPPPLSLPPLACRG